MREILRKDAERIYTYAIKECMPNRSVEKALTQSFEHPKGKLIVVSIGKAGWEMAKCAYEILGDRVHSGIVITKYNHSKGGIGKLEIYEGAHPVVDFNCIRATKRALELTEGLTADDTVLLLVSGGGSALLEDVSCPLEKMQELTQSLLKSGADINEINAVRKHISNVKGGRFAEHAYPARVFAVVLSDVIGNDLSTIASGPACADSTTVADCYGIIDKYGIDLDEEMRALISRETPKRIDNARHIISGSVSELCQYAKEKAEEIGYRSYIVSDSVQGDICELTKKIKELKESSDKIAENQAYIFGGEITVKVKGNGKGGRNQELALRCAEIIKNSRGVSVFSVGSDGTDGPTDMAGGYVDWESEGLLKQKGLDIKEYIENNDSYNALNNCDGLIYTGPTGTNVNDLYVLLVRKDMNDGRN
ncbi:MAG: glycerate kinase [Clostridia bacterium]|nr:glycerate kinase [Clostridia bacterium]